MRRIIAFVKLLSAPAWAGRAVARSCPGKPGLCGIAAGSLRVPHTGAWLPAW